MPPPCTGILIFSYSLLINRVTEPNMPDVKAFYLILKLTDKIIKCFKYMHPQWHRLSIDSVAKFANLTAAKLDTGNDRSDVFFPCTRNVWSILNFGGKRVR